MGPGPAWSQPVADRWPPGCRAPPQAGWPVPAHAVGQGTKGTERSGPAHLAPWDGRQLLSVWRPELGMLSLMRKLPPVRKQNTPEVSRCTKVTHVQALLIQERTQRQGSHVARLWQVAPETREVWLSDQRDVAGAWLARGGFSGRKTGM